jgi:DNA-binding XRE family transcriptional regulator
VKSNKPETAKLLYDPDHCLLYGAEVRAARGVLGLSQSELADMLGVTRTTVLRLEKGIAPLRLALCESAVDTLKKAGVSSNAMDEIRYTMGVPHSLDISVNFFKLL